MHFSVVFLLCSFIFISSVQGKVQKTTDKEGNLHYESRYSHPSNQNFVVFEGAVMSFNGPDLQAVIHSLAAVFSSGDGEIASEKEKELPELPALPPNFSVSTLDEEGAKETEGEHLDDEGYENDSTKTVKCRGELCLKAKDNGDGYEWEDGR